MPNTWARPPVPALWGELESSAQLGIRRPPEERPCPQGMPNRNLR
jgi:hypothetical protein